MIKFLISACLLITVSLGFSQSGYMGKKTFVEYNTFISTALIQPNKNWESGYTSFNVGHNLGINRVLSKRSVLGVSYQIAKTGMTFDLDNPSYSYYSNKEQYLTIRYMLNVSTLSLDYKVFSNKRSVVAPLGVYWAFKLNYHTITFNDVYTGIDVAQTNSFEIKLGMGVHKIYSNRFIVDLAIELDASPWQWEYSTYSESSVSSYTGSNDLEDEVLKIGKGRVNAMYFIGARIGVGYLF